VNHQVPLGREKSVTPRHTRQLTLALVPVVAIIAAIVGGLFLSAPVMAENPFRLGSQVEDRAGALGDRQQDVEEALQTLLAEARVQLWVAYVDTFSGLRAEEWAHETAIESDLGLRDILLAVAVEDRAYAYSVDEDFPLTDQQINDLMAFDVEPELSSNDWAGAAIGAAAGMQQALRGDAVTTDVAPSTAGEDRGFSYGTVFIAIALVAIALLVWRGVKRQRSKRGAQLQAPATGTTAAPTISLAELRRRASEELVETDDAIKTSTDELGFAQAQFGEEEAAPFERALSEATRELNEAFNLYRQFDEHAEKDVQQEILAAVLQHTAAANEKLDAQAERFDRLRDLENKAEEVLTVLERQLAELEVDLPTATQELSQLASVYSPAALKSVVTNPNEAALRIRFAREQITAGREDLAAGRRGAAAVGVLAAQEATGQAQTFLAAIGRLGTDLDQAREQIDEALAETKRDIAEARAAGAVPELAALVAAAEAAVGAATVAAAADGGRDPLASLRHLEDADEALENALVAVREQRAQRAKAATMLERTLLAARAEISAARDYITTHRGAIGSGPRARLAEAQHLLTEATALRASDPIAAVNRASRAHELARRALGEAQSETQRATIMRTVGGIGGSVARSSLEHAGGGTGDLASSIAGAILGGILTRSGSGASARRGRGGSFGGRSRVPSFGGRSTRMRRGGGGRF